MSGNRNATPKTAAAARFLKSTQSGLLFGNGNVDIGARIRNGNSSVVGHVRPINSVTKERRSGVFLESNKVESRANPWLAISRIMCHLNISDEVAKSTTRKKLHLLLPRDIPQSVSEKSKDEIRKTYPVGNRYLSYPETKEGRGRLNKYARRRDGAGSWEILKGFSYF